MKTLFIVPKFPARTYPGKTMAPDYLAGALVNRANIHKEDIEILDLDVLGQDILEEKLRKENYGLIGISFLSFQTDEAMQIAEKADIVMREKGRRNPLNKDYVPIIVGGHGTSQCDEIVPLYNEIDAWAVEEGLETIIDIADSAREGRFLQDRKNIPGLKYYDNETEAVRTTPKRNLVERLDDFVPVRLSHYQEYDFEVFDDKKTAQLLSQLGCKGACVYCHESTSGRDVRKRSIESIEKELNELVKQGYKAIYFDDSTFTFDRKRTLEIVGLMKKFNESHDIIWGFNTRVDCLDKELIEKIKDSGCVYMFAGVESLVPEVLAGMNKLRGSSPDYEPVKTEQDYVEKAKQSYRWMQEAGLSTCSFMIFGGPTLNHKTINGERKTLRGLETLEQAKRTIEQAVWELSPDYLSINVLRFIPDSVMSSSPAYSLLRGQEGKIHAGHFSKRWRAINDVKSEEFRKHPIYTAYEAAGQDYPIPPHMTPEHCYSILEHLVEQVNLKNRKTGKQTAIVVDKTFEKYMPKDERGVYHLAPFDNMSEHEQEQKPSTLRSRIKSFVRPALAVAASVAIAVGSWLYVSNNNSAEDVVRENDLKLFSMLSKEKAYFFNPIVRYIDGDKELAELNSDERERISTLWTMTSTGQEYSILSKDPRWKADYDAMTTFRNKITLKN